MTAQTNAPIIIKRVKKVVGGAHHGGAWKVAYADFVTAMMAFFLLMWLLNATTEKQRKGIADYFSPTIPIARVSGGGDGNFGGDSVFTEETLAHNGIGGEVAQAVEATDEESADVQAETEALQRLDEMLTGRAGESMVSEMAQRHILTKVTDAGLVIELFDLPGEPLFFENGAVPTPVMSELTGMMARVFKLVENGVAITGHVSAQPVVVATTSIWPLSSDRAQSTRQLLEASGLHPNRTERVTGHADRKPMANNPMAIRNNRIELVLLRSDIE